MIPALLCFMAVSSAEFLLWVPPLWKRRRILSRLIFTALVLASTALVAANLSVWTVLLAIFSMYRCLNLARIATGRIQADYLFHASRRTSYLLMSWQLLVAGAAYLTGHYGFGPYLWRGGTAAAVLICAAVILASALRNLSAIRPPKLSRHFTDTELPAVTVAIPARNETTDLEECLQSLLASTYPKMEILVLDDCSQNKRTPEIIRGFAHAGARFVAGKQPPESWLAKNYAYAQLAEEASGDILLFCGVDTRFGTGSVDALVRTMLQERKDMLSVLPRNVRTSSKGLAAWFLQVNRYAWELALPRQLIERPPVLSTCWLITRAALEASGGFKAVRRKGVPESYFARIIAARGKYTFLQSGDSIDLSSRKSPEEQRATAVRTRYLQLHRRPELAALVGLAEFGVLVWPLILTAVSLAGRRWPTAVIAGTAFVINCLVYASLFSLTYRRFFVRGIWLFPVAAVYDIWLLNYSMWRYEFREVIWKGRNVCIPVMRVVSKLPES